METQEQEVEAFKSWWKTNGKVVVAGIVIGLGGVVGWNWWQTQTERAAEAASALYTEVVNAADAADSGTALSAAKRMLEDHPKSGYAALAALVSAKSAMSAGQVDEAVGQLRWVVSNSSQAQVTDLARLRLARVLRSAGDYDPALSELANVEAASFAPLVAELRGDIAHDQKNMQAAIESYEAALAAPGVDASTAQRVGIKLGDLGVVVSAQ